MRSRRSSRITSESGSSGGGAGLASPSSSFASAPERAPPRFVNIFHGGGGNLGGGKGGGGNGGGGDTEDWTDDRAARLAEEVGRAGVVTTAGYNAVLQRFLQGEEADRGRRRTTPSARKERTLFGSLKSMCSASSADANGEPVGGGLFGSLVKRPTFSLDADGGSEDNIAPRYMESSRQVTKTGMDAYEDEEEDTGELRAHHESEDLSFLNHCSEGEGHESAVGAGAARQSP